MRLHGSFLLQASFNEELGGVPAVRTSTFKEWFGDCEYAAENTIDISAKERNAAKDILNSLRDKVLFSKQENVEASISKKGRSKMTSDAALNKSKRNGFTIEQHYSAVAILRHCLAIP